MKWKKKSAASSWRQLGHGEGPVTKKRRKVKACSFQEQGPVTKKRRNVKACSFQEQGPVTKKRGKVKACSFQEHLRAQAVRKEPSWEKDIGAECVNESMRDLAIPFSQLSRAQHSD